MFERFTDDARRAVVLAQEEARLLDHDYIGTEHILLGLLREGNGVAATALTELGVSLDSVRVEVARIVGRGGGAPSEHIPFTPRAKKVLELSLRASLQLGHNDIGTEHILVGILREGEGVAAMTLAKLGVDLGAVREKLGELMPETDLGEVFGAVARELRVPPQAAPVTEKQMPTCPSCSRPLAETAAMQVVPVMAPQGAPPRAVTFVYCRSCGRTLGILSS